MSESVSFTVYGKPQPAGSKKAFQHPRTGRVVVVDDAKGSRPWKQEVAGAALEARGERELLHGPISLAVEFYVARPKGHFGTGRNATRVRPSAPWFPTVKPDVTKLVRAVEDALNGLIWRDDAQVIDQIACKRYGEPERCDVLVLQLRERS